MVDLLRFIVELATDATVRDRFLTDPEAVWRDTVTGAGDLTGEDVEAAAHAARAQVPEDRAARLDVSGRVRPDAGETSADAALRLAEALAEALDRRDPAPVVELPAPAPVAPDDEDGPTVIGAGEPVPDHPPGLDRPRLWAVEGRDGDDPVVDPDHPVAPRRPTLAPVPDPEGGFAFSVLELVQLPQGVADAGIEPGALATVIAVHDDRDDCYEIEVSDADGGRRFLGTVTPDRLAPARH